MKKLLILIALLGFAASWSYAQGVPKKFNYQAVPRMATGDLLPANSPIDIRFFITENGTTQVAYAEEQTLIVSQHGVISAAVGDGTQTGSFPHDMDAINWLSSSYYLSASIDLNKNGTFEADENFGSSQLLSVPYAMVAGNASSSSVNITGNNGVVAVGTSPDITITLSPNVDTDKNDDLTETTMFDGAVSGTFNTITLNADAVGSNHIADGGVQANDLSNMGASAGEILKFDGTNWVAAADEVGIASVSVNAGVGINVTTVGGNSFTVENTAPDQTVTVTGGTGISVTGAYPNFTVETDGSMVSGGGSTNYLPLFSSPNSISNSVLRQNSSGQVGVGILPNPNYQMTIKDGLMLRTDPSTNQFFGIAINTEGQAVFQANGDPTSRSVVIDDDSGFVGIGTTTPQRKLHVTGDTRFEGDVYFGSVEFLKDGGAFTIETNSDIIPEDNYPYLGTSFRRWNRVYCVNLFQSSDRSLKKNIHASKYGLKDVLKLKPSMYEWKEGEENQTESIGFIAQDVEQIIPELVAQTEHYREKDGTVKTRPVAVKSIQYTGLIPVLTTAIQEQQTMIDAQNAKIEALENQINDLKTMVEAMAAKK